MVPDQPSRRVVVGVLLALALAGLACNLENLAGNVAQPADSGPLVVLIAPVNGSTFAEGVPVELHAIAQDTGSGVARIEFRMDDFPIGEAIAQTAGGEPSLAARATWIATEKRNHLLTVEAFRADGSSLGLADAVLTVSDQPGAVSGASATPGTPASATIPPAASATPQLTVPGAPVAVVAADTLNVRQGPGTAYATVGTLARGERVSIVGRNADGTWWAVAFGGGTAWVFAQLVTPEGDVSQVPLVAPPSQN